MPSIYVTETMKYDVSWEELDNPSLTLRMLLGPFIDYYLWLRKQQRPIVCNRRAAKYLEKQEDMDKVAQEQRRVESEGGSVRSGSEGQSSGPNSQQEVEMDMAKSDAAMKD